MVNNLKPFDDNITMQIVDPSNTNAGKNEFAHLSEVWKSALNAIANSNHPEMFELHVMMMIFTNTAKN